MTHLSLLTFDSSIIYLSFESVFRRRKKNVSLVSVSVDKIDQIIRITRSKLFNSCARIDRWWPMRAIKLIHEQMTHLQAPGQCPPCPVCPDLFLSPDIQFDVRLLAYVASASCVPDLISSYASDSNADAAHSITSSCSRFLTHTPLHV